MSCCCFVQWQYVLRLMIRLQSHAVRAFALLDAFTVDLPPDRTLTNEQTFWYPEYVQHSVAELICALLI